ncbi:hypothetical protein HCI99_13150 [Listeria booriae]|uniref:Uncharacterized protein n=1 Tax=Listeria booriae TaxID=1552123 RepID=A0A7X0XEK8_9LIST|nr:hypothetical protein [Listeria booriae]MBC1492765.1 hypothetical protein [Listeria booriae]
MYLILKPEYKIIIDENRTYFFNVFIKNSFHADNTETINWILLKDLCYRGITVEFLKDNRNNTLDFLKYLLKTKRESFILAESIVDIKRTINCRSIISLGLDIGSSEKILKKYIQAYEETIITVLGDLNGTLQEFLNQNGLNCTSKLNQCKDGSQIVIINKDYQAINNFERDENIVVIPYSIAHMTMGPCDFDLSRQNVKLQQEITESEVNIASFANITSLYSVMLNCLLYLIGNIHEILYTDAGLPLQREFKFHLPSLKLTATPVYKEGNN